MASQLAVVFVDVDGVINAEDRGIWDVDTWRTRTVFVPNGGTAYRVRFSSALIEGLREIEALPGVDMRWLTTWGEAAPARLSRKIGIGASWLSNTPGNSWPDDVYWWKAGEVRDALQHAARVVWIDDDIRAWVRGVRATDRADALDWMHDERLLTVCPDSTIGLQPHNIGGVKHFILTGERPTT